MRAVRPTTLVISDGSAVTHLSSALRIAEGALEDGAAVMLPVREA
jgi:hypothetical protein